MANGSLTHPMSKRVSNLGDYDEVPSPMAPFVTPGVLLVRDVFINMLLRAQEEE